MQYTINHILAADTRQLADALAIEPATSRIEVQMLLQRVLGVTRAYLVAHADHILSVAEYSQYQALLQRRVTGEPMAHILGEREFFGLRFRVTPDTLIPRPDTELLVELALQRIPLQERCRVLDLGTGTGAIALSIASQRPQADVMAVDASAMALAVAQENASELQLANVQFQLSDWFESIGEAHFELIVSNPPYVAEGDPHLEQGDVRFEPDSALVSGRDGLDDLKRIIAAAPLHLLSGSWLLLEHGYDQAGQVRELLINAGFSEVFTSRDLGGMERVSGGRLM